MTTDSLPPTEEVLKEIRRKFRMADISQEDLGALLEPALDQSIISRTLRGKGHLRYSEAKRLLDTLTGLLSLIPTNKRAKDIATLNIEYADLDESLHDVSRRMFRRGFSQLPVRDERGLVVGTLTEQCLLKLLISPPSFGERGRQSKLELEKLHVRDLLAMKFLEDTPEVSPNDKLQIVAASLQHYYAVFLKEAGKLEGIVTRADLLKLIRGKN